MFAWNGFGRARALPRGAVGRAHHTTHHHQPKFAATAITTAAETETETEATATATATPPIAPTTTEYVCRRSSVVHSRPL